MNIFDHDALFEQIGFSSQSPSQPQTYNQAAPLASDEAQRSNLARKYDANGVGVTKNELLGYDRPQRQSNYPNQTINSCQDVLESKQIYKVSQNQRHVRQPGSFQSQTNEMTLGELLSRRSARNSSLDSQNILIAESQYPEGTPQVTAKRGDDNHDQKNVHFGSSKLQMFNGQTSSGLQQNHNLFSMAQHQQQQERPSTVQDVTWPNLTQAKNNYNEMYSSNELGSLANARPMPPPSNSEQVSSMHPISSTSGFLTKREIMKVTIDLGDGVQETLLVREGESAEMVSRAFAMKFDLTEETEFLLREQIEYNLAQIPSQSRSEMSTNTLNRSQITQKIPSSVASAPILSQMKKKMFSEPISEEGHDSEDAEIDDDEQDQSRISNINSMGPAQWSNVKREIRDEHLNAEIVRKKLVYSQLKENLTARSGKQEPMKQGSNASGLIQDDTSSYNRLLQRLPQQPVDNYGIVLYLKGKAQKLTQEQNRAKEREIKAKKELEGATFKPYINESSLGGVRDKGMSSEDFLLFQGRLASERLEKLKKEVKEQEMEEATFKPKVLKKSQQIVRQRNERINAGNVEEIIQIDPIKKSKELYQEVFARKQKIERLQQEPPDQECTFQPKLVTRPKTERMNKSAIVSSSNGIESMNIHSPIREVDESHEATNSNVFERLVINAQQIPEKRKGREMAEKVRSSVDIITGQPLFKPKTGKTVPNRALVVKKDGGISNYLYKKHQQKEEAQQRQRENLKKVTQQEMEQEKAQTKNKISELLYEQKVRIQLEQLFLAFDADQNGYISADEINLDNVSAEILELFAPLFEEMESLGESLSQTDFCDSAYNLFKNLGMIEKSVVLNFKREKISLIEKHKNKEQTYKPKINPNSEELVQQSELHGINVVDRLQWAELQKQEKLYNMQQEQLKIDMKECSFSPTIDPNSEQIAQTKIQKHLASQFSAIDMGKDLHEIAELQQSPNFQGVYHKFRPDVNAPYPVTIIQPYQGQSIQNWSY